MPVLWTRNNGGYWNGNPSADPAARLGGINVGGFSGGPIWLTLQIGVGFRSDSNTTVNFGATAFNFTPPVGAKNWTSSPNVPATWDPVTQQFAILSGGNLTVHSAIAPSGTAQVWANGPQENGLFYGEIVTNSYIVYNDGTFMGLSNTPGSSAFALPFQYYDCALAPGNTFCFAYFLNPNSVLCNTAT